MPIPEIPEKTEGVTHQMCCNCKRGKIDGFKVRCDGTLYDINESACFRWVAFDAKTGGIK